MRLWHYKLIPVLPREQLLGQWRECCLIARNIYEKGTPNHILVNPITKYPYRQFLRYCEMVSGEMFDRGYSVDTRCLTKYLTEEEQEMFNRMTLQTTMREGEILFTGWHNRRYMVQCIMNMEEKFDRGGIPYDEWEVLLENDYVQECLCGAGLAPGRVEWQTKIN